MQNPSSPEVVLACVVAGDLCISYSRAGRGAPLIVLSDDAGLRAALLDALPGNFGAIAPTVLPLCADGRVAAAEFPRWLWSFLDALGIDRATFAVTPSLAQAMNAATENAPERVVGVVTLDSRGVATTVRTILDFTAAETQSRH